MTDPTKVACSISHFAINADDLARARRFYEGVFGWTFEPFGTPDFFLIKTGAPGAKGIEGVLQKRRIPRSGDGVIGFECTVAVPDIDEAGRAVVAHGGKIVMHKFHLAEGKIIQFLDTEGNVVCAMEYEANARQTGAG
jgi:predicted enzyme related to lactoylglutathione lyase